MHNLQQVLLTAPWFVFSVFFTTFALLAGSTVAKLHESHLIHGDITTSNLLIQVHYCIQIEEITGIGLLQPYLLGRW